ncbi:ribosomal protein S6 kinase beta-2-like isoform X1 [Vespula maculifrons]|uniref:Ribosomal protein S6 kinase beta-2-like isoform X1 n=1 Tax=Vespula maculifrons TaxID=7453 RepID=A0ABD2BTL2_VESMC
MKSDVRLPPWDFDWAAFMLMHVRTGGAIYRDSTLFCESPGVHSRKHESGVESRRQRRRRTRVVAGGGSGGGGGGGGGGDGISNSSGGSGGSNVRYRRGSWLGVVPTKGSKVSLVAR